MILTTTKKEKSKLRPRDFYVFIWTLLIVAFDQFTKYLVVKNITQDSLIPYRSFFDGFIRIVHVRNKNIAFSIGRGLPPAMKIVLFIGLASLLLIFLIYLILKDKSIDKKSRTFLAIILGGGLGNMIDRVLRPAGVVDFMDVDFWDININWGPFRYQMERWPIYNVADASVIVAVVLLFLYSFIGYIRSKKK